MDRRARLTLPDIVFVTFSIAVLGALVPVWFARFEANLSWLSAGEAYVWRLVVPLAVVVLLLGVWRKATAGGGV